MPQDSTCSAIARCRAHITGLGGTSTPGGKYRRSHIQGRVALLVMTDVHRVRFAARRVTVDMNGEMPILPEWKHGLGVFVHALHMPVYPEAAAAFVHRVSVFGHVLA